MRECGGVLFYVRSVIQMAGLLTNILYVLGKNFYTIITCCIVLTMSVMLLNIYYGRRRPVAYAVAGKGGSTASGNERTLLKSMESQDDDIWIVVRRYDLMPVYVVGDLSAVGVTLEKLQTDIACILSRLKAPDEGKKFWKAYREWDGKGLVRAEFELVNGQWFRITAYRSEDNQSDIFVLHRVTEEHRRENAYEQRLFKAEEASQFKTSFLFRMSHEIRTPMNGITGTLMLAESKLPQEHPAMQYLSKANELSDHLLSLINDILDMARIEAGKVELEHEPFSLRAMGKRLYDMFAKTLEDKGIHYEVNFEEMAVDWVLGDELRVSQVIINFLSNAVKFTNKGEVIVTFRQMMIQGDSADVMIRVHDTGIGMNPDFIDRIFRPFEQEDISTTRRFGGTGLGMTISDHIVRLMGGQISVDSMPGSGSDFSVFLTFPMTEKPESCEVAEASAVPPDAAAVDAIDIETVTGFRNNAVEQKNDITEEQPQQKDPDDEMFDCRILMAEDNEINAMIAGEILRDRGAQVDIAEDGQKAVDMFAAQPENYYDLILMDIQMPVMDGREAARTIRALERADAATIPVYALSADAFVEDERRSKESGMNGHLTKPINYDLLWDIIRNITAGRSVE